MHRSKTILSQGDAKSIPTNRRAQFATETESRTSKTAWLNATDQRDHPVVQAFEDRVDMLLHTPEIISLHNGDHDGLNNKASFVDSDGARPVLSRRGSNRENLQLIHYGPGEYYSLHTDKINSNEFVGDDSKQQKARTRAATLLTYLNTPPRGGGTYFPYACDGGATIKAQKGKAILFWNQTPSGKNDERSKHASLKVLESPPKGKKKEEDEKWAITAWIQECNSENESELYYERKNRTNIVRDSDGPYRGWIRYFHRLCRSPIANFWDRK